MSNENISAKLVGNFSLSAKNSQTIPLAFIGLAAISLIAAFFFIYLNNENFGYALITSFAFSLVGVLLWFRSHKLSELENSKPTEFYVDPNCELRISTDSRALESPLAVQNIAKIFSLMAHRVPLPLPDGMVNDQGNPDPLRKSEAEQIVAMANSKAESTIQVFDKKIIVNQLLSEPFSGETNIDSSQMRTNIPSSN